MLLSTKAATWQLETGCRPCSATIGASASFSRLKDGRRNLLAMPAGGSLRTPIETDPPRLRWLFQYSNHVPKVGPATAGLERGWQAEIAGDTPSFGLLRSRHKAALRADKMAGKMRARRTATKLVHAQIILANDQHEVGFVTNSPALAQRAVLV